LSATASKKNKQIADVDYITSALPFPCLWLLLALDSAKKIIFHKHT